MPDLKIEGEMLELAKHIINTKKGGFDPRQFDDRYEEAVADLVKAKIEGRMLQKKKPPPAAKPSDLLQALRESAGMSAPTKTKPGVANANAVKSRQKATRASESKARSTGVAHQRRAG